MLKIQNRENTCACASCPLNSTERVFSSGPEDATIMIIQDYPSEGDFILGENLKDNPANWLNHVFKEVGLRRHRIYLTSVIQCPPNTFKMNSYVDKKGIYNCQGGLLQEIIAMENLQVIVPMGDIALKALDLSFSLLKARGSVFPRKKYVIIPTYHPLFVMRGKIKEQVTWINDWNKIKEISIDGFKELNEEFNTHPTKDEITLLDQELHKKQMSLAIDIESTGIDPLSSEIVVTGVGLSTTRAVSFPKLRKNGYDYWENGGRAVSRDVLKRLLKDNPTIYQNAMFDVRFLEEKGYEIGNIQHDIMLLHHCLHPELPHSLDYITSVYGRTPYWKDTLKKSPTRILQMDDKELRTYNLRDCVVLHQILPQLIEEVKAQGTYWIYENISLPLIRPLIEMMNTGLPVNKKRLSSWKSELNRNINKLETEMRLLLDLGAMFVFTKTALLQYLLFNVLTTAQKRDIALYEWYHSGECTLKRTTKKYIDLADKVLVLQNIKSLSHPKGLYIRRTTSKGISLDDEALNAYKSCALTRLGRIKRMRTLRAEHTKEMPILEKQIDFVSLLLQWRKLSKLKSTYTKFPVAKDNRVHGSYKIHGTATGRLSSQQPNMQNIPKIAKKIFIAEKGQVFVNADFSNLELRVLAAVTDDDVLQEMFDKGLNVHTENAKKLGVERRVAKTYIFGRNYGGSLKFMYSQVMNANPDLKLSYQDFCDMDKKYFDAHPKYKEWFNNTTEEVLEKRELINVFGRKRIFLGSETDIKKEGLNFPIQSAAGDIMSLSIIEIYKNKKAFKSKLSGTVHDSLITETPYEELPKWIAYVKKIMERDIEIKGKIYNFKTDFEIGKSYGEMVDYNLYLKYKDIPDLNVDSLKELLIENKEELSNPKEVAKYLIAIIEDINE